MIYELLPSNPPLPTGLAAVDELPRTEQALASGPGSWLFLCDNAAGVHGEQAQAASPLADKLCTLIDKLPAGLVVADAATRRFAFVNPWFCNMLGYTLTELLSMGPLDIHPPEAWIAVQADFAHNLVGEPKPVLCIPVLRKDGSTFMANLERVPLMLGGHTYLLAIFTDVSEQMQAQTALQASEAQLHTLVDTIPDLIWLKDANGAYQSCNPAFERFFGAPESAIVGKTDFDFVSPEQAQAFQAHDRAAMAAQRPSVNEEWITYANTGERALLETTKVPMRDADGQLLGVLGISHNITQQHQAAQTLDAERLRLQTAIDAVQAGTWEWDLADDVICFNERMGVILGYPDLNLRQGPYRLYVSWIHPEDQPRQEQLMTRHLQGALPSFEMDLRMRHQDGHWVWCRTLGRVMQRTPDGQPQLVAGLTIDISDQKTHREQINFVTEHDALTGLPNRKLFVSELGRSLAALAGNAHLAVAYIDLDNFSAINQTHGAELGNQLIVAVSQRLIAEMNEHQYLAHIGGDEFAVILKQLAQPQDSMAPVERLLRAVAEPLQLNTLTLHITASVGVALMAPGDRIDAEQLLRQADQAMYRAKQSGKNCRYQFDLVTDEVTRARLARIDEVRQGLLGHEFMLYYQPKVRLSTGKVIGFEALIRWQHPKRGLLLPFAFISLLDQHPMAITLGDWVIEAALAQLAQWQSQGLETAVSVNIDAMQLLDADFADRLQQQLRRQPTVAPRQLELEILETGALGNMAHVSALIAQLQALGLACALDDFGTGYSSLTFLKQLGAQTLKIDQSFVRGMLDDAEHATIVNSVLGLARNFDRKALAEGVETEAHGRLLIEFGCEYGQGYAIARPMPAEQVPAWLAQWRTPDSWAHSHSVGPRGISMLLAEVEHRAWFKQLQAYVALPSQAQPPTDSQQCRFGHWLHKPDNRERLRQQPAFAQLDALHQALHARGSELISQLHLGQLDAVQYELGAVELLSQQLLAELRQVRDQPSDTTPVNSGFGEL